MLLSIVLGLALGLPFSFSGQNAQAPPPSPTLSAELQSIRIAGYNAGFRAGATDYRAQQPYSFQSKPEYQSATLGYDPNAGIAQHTYEMNFRGAYESGYDDGFYGRISNDDAPRQRAYSAEKSAQPAAASQPAARMGAPEPRTLPAGTALDLKLNNTLGTSSSQLNDPFTATVATAITGPSGETLVPAGSTVAGHVAAVSRAGSVSGSSSIRLEFDQLRLTNGETYPLQAELSRADTGGGAGKIITGKPSTGKEGEVEQSKTRRTVGTAAAGGVIGALIGGIAGGGTAAAISGAVGAGLGVLLSSQSGDLDLPSGTPVTITLTQPVQLATGHL